MKLSLNGQGFIKKWESCRLKAYLDGGGVWTIGWGHTGPEVRKGLVWTQQQADDTFTNDVAPREGYVNSLVKVKLTQNQFDALVSLVYNIGGTAFRNSTLLKLLNSGDYKSIPAQFWRWNMDNGIVIKGLTNRRKGESVVFLTP